MIIDTHVHFIKPFDSKGNPQIYSPGAKASAEEYIELMDESGMDAAFFISWSPEDIPSDLTGKGMTADQVRDTLSLDYALEVMEKFGDRFYWLPCHLGPKVENHMAIARENLEKGAIGLKLPTSFWGELPDDPREIAMCDLAKEFDACIVFDTSFWYLGKDNPADPDCLGEGHREVARRITDFQDYANHLRAIFSAYPTVNFSLAHAGARNFTPEHAAESGQLISEFPNVYADLGALRTESPSLDILVETAGPDRIMFGTDFPHFARGPEMLRLIDEVRKPGRFAPGVADMILGENALTFIKHRAPGLKSE